jgi:deoxyribodipyrimidine photo-lyase
MLSALPFREIPFAKKRLRPATKAPADCYTCRWRRRAGLDPVWIAFSPQLLLSNKIRKRQMPERFATDLSAILGLVDAIDPVEYGRTRNYIDGAVTRLSPYISRGVLSTRQVLHALLEKDYRAASILPFIKELCWRDYFQRVAQARNLDEAIRQEQEAISNQGISTALVEGRTGIEGIDRAIADLYETGYMHNHCRMYVASLACNVARSHWRHPAQWMYYHLLDGDWASNACSWQWVAGANSHKRYYANQENINRYLHTHQAGTFLDRSYEELERMEMPSILRDVQTMTLKTELPQSAPIELKPGLPVFVYNYYNLDPAWHREEKGNRVLLLEPDFFARYPVSRQCLDFTLALAKNIPGIQLHVGSFHSLREAVQPATIYYKEHPLNVGYRGQEEARSWIVEEVKGYYPSFFAYWKRIEKYLVP